MENNCEGIEKLIEEIAEMQQQTLLKTAQRIIPHVIQDDLLQPNDFSLLENNPLFRYEEGVLAGIHTVAMAIRSHKSH